VLDTLQRLGVDVVPPLGSIYVWMPVPEGEGSEEFADRLLEQAGVVVGPGAAYGPFGEGHVRLSLTVPDDRLAEAMERIATLYT
jgi:LL-diaminopimelate aminotransferase